MKWIDATEIVAGMCLRNLTDPSNKLKIDPNAINPQFMYPPYAETLS